jgi:hypothetical protein
LVKVRAAGLNPVRIARAEGLPWGVFGTDLCGHLRSQQITAKPAPAGLRSSVLQMMGNQRVCVPMTHLVPRLQQGDQFHVFEIARCLENGEPMAHGVAIRFLDVNRPGNRGGPSG